MKTSTRPPAHLSTSARRMWSDLRAEYVIDDAAGLSLLQAACEAFQRAQEARVVIAKEGAVVQDRFGQRRPHPACAIERDARGQMVSALRAMRLAPGAEE